jgi:hypothetical protein
MTLTVIRFANTAMRTCVVIWWTGRCGNYEFYYDFVFSFALTAAAPSLLKEDLEKELKWLIKVLFSFFSKTLHPITSDVDTCMEY